MYLPRDAMLKKFPALRHPEIAVARLLERDVPIYSVVLVTLFTRWMKCSGLLRSFAMDEIFKKENLVTD